MDTLFAYLLDMTNRVTTWQMFGRVLSDTPSFADVL